MSDITFSFTPLERQYFRLYAAAAKREYDTLNTAARLMDDDTLGLVCPVHASYVAAELQSMQKDFDTSLRKLRLRHGLNQRTGSSGPTPDDMAKLIASSFFKLLTVLKFDEDDVGVRKDGGWYSGTPADWQRNLAALKAAFAVSGDEDDALSPMLAAIAQLFKMLTNKNLPYMGHSQIEESSQDDDWGVYDNDDHDDSAPEYFD